MSDTKRTPLGRARGLGSAKEGVDHWWGLRLSSIALVPLTLWFVYQALRLTGASYDVVRAWIAAPLNALLLILLILSTFYHVALGTQVVIEDYVHTESRKIIALIALKFACIILTVACLFSVFKISLGN